MKNLRRPFAKAVPAADDTDPQSHHIVLDYMKGLAAGGQPDEEFESKTLSRNLRFDSYNLAELIFAWMNELEIPRNRVLNFLRVGIPGGGDATLATLIERISILAGEFNENDRFLLLSSGVVGDRAEIRPINEELDRVEIVVKYLQAISSLKELAPEDPLAVDATSAWVDDEEVPLHNKMQVASPPDFDPARTQGLLLILEQGAEQWNQWRSEHPDEFIDLRGIVLPDEAVSLRNANLQGANLSGSSLIRAELQDANLSGAILQGADLQGAQLQNARLPGALLDETNLILADFTGADLRLASFNNSFALMATFDGADLRKARFESALIIDGSFVDAQLKEAILTDAILRGADLTHANLAHASVEGANLVEANLQGADLSDCRVYGASIWKVNLEGAKQENLVVTPSGESTITVDNLEIAQFTYLLLENARIRAVIDTITTKTILILGRFAPDRKVVLDALRDEMRKRDFVPIVFDFEKPTQRDFTETIKTLAGMCHFVIVDITSPKSSPLELQATVPDYMIPFVPIIQENEQPFAMFQDLKQKYDWVLDTLIYDSRENLVRALDKAIIAPALIKHDELMLRKSQEAKTRHISEYL